MAYEVPDAYADLEERRHQYLSAFADSESIRCMDHAGVGPGWRCLDIGAGGGSVARLLAERVTGEGQVLATDIDLRFLKDLPANVEVRRHDILRDPLPEEGFDFVHARGVLEHIPEREQALENMARALRPGGWLAIGDVDWVLFDQQEIPEPFRTLALKTRELGSQRLGYDAFWGRRKLGAMRSLGLEAVEAFGTVKTMNGGTPSAEWYVSALEWASPIFIQEGIFEASLVKEALEQARQPDFQLLSPVMLSVVGRRPAKSGGEPSQGT